MADIITHLLTYTCSPILHSLYGLLHTLWPLRLLYPPVLLILVYFISQNTLSSGCNKRASLFVQLEHRAPR